MGAYHDCGIRATVGIYLPNTPEQSWLPYIRELLPADVLDRLEREPVPDTDSVTPARPNKSLPHFRHARGVKDSDSAEGNTPFGHSDYQTIVANIKKFAGGGRTAVVSTINGDSNVPFYKELAN